MLQTPYTTKMLLHYSCCYTSSPLHPFEKTVSEREMEVYNFYIISFVLS